MSQPTLTGRFDVPVRLRTVIPALVRGMADGIRLRCPSCGKGRLFASGITPHRTCPQCGVTFERSEEGDFLGAMVTVYAVTAFLLLLMILAFNLATNLNLSQQLVVAGLFAIVFPLGFYRNLKGIWVALLIALTKWMR